MSISLELVNLNQLFTSSPIEPVILNDMSSVTVEDREKIDELTTSSYHQTDVFSNRPSCSCGNTVDGYRLGVICKVCRTPVQEMFDQELIPKVWIRAPQHVSSLINPMIWTMLSDKFTKSGFNLIEWLCNTDYQPTCNRPSDEIEELLTQGVERGYNNFVMNFNKYFDILSNLKHFAKKRDDSLKQLIEEERDSVFCQYLPLPNKAMMIQEHSKVGSYIDPMVLQIIAAIKTIRSIDTPMAMYTQRQRENRTVKTIIKLAAFYYECYHLLLAKKQGLIRKHIFGTRCHFSTRAVISSTTTAHRYDELEISWGQGATMLKLHLMNKLLRRGYTPNEATSLLQEYTVKYHPLLDEMFQEIINESRDNGLYCIFVRNPSLSRSSTQRMKIVKIKTDPNDITVSLSILAVVGFNADKSLT